MRFCQDHWDKLRAAITARGLDHLIAKDGKRAAANFAAEAQDGPSLRTFDPLMAAHWAIIGNAANVVPGGMLTLMAPLEDGGDRCPLCYLNAENPAGHNYDEWIDRAADDAKATADRLIAEEAPDV